MTIVSAVLAAGGSRRLGRPKQLVRFRGEPLVCRAVKAASLPEISERAVVLGAHANAIAEALDAGVVRLENEEWAEGIASSIRTAVAWAEARGAAALVLLLADQPLIEAAHVERLIGAWRLGTVCAAASAYAGALGAPALFDARLFSELRALEGDRGAGKILRLRADVAAVPCGEGGVDIDTPAELEGLGS